VSPVCGAGSTQLTVDVSGGGVTRWLFDGDGHFSIGSCEGNDQPLHVVAGKNGPGALLAPLVAGKYFIDAVVDGGAAALSVDTNALPALTAFDCAAAPAVPDDLSRYQNLTLFFPSSVGSQFTTFANGNDRLGVLSLAADDPSATGSLCTSCDAATCSSTSVGGGLGTDVQTGAVLSIPLGPAVTATFTWTGAP